MTSRVAGPAPLVLLVAAAVASVVSVGSCRTTPPPTTTTTATITVAAAASLTEPLTQIAADFRAANPGTDVRLSFDSSATLVAQIQAGAPADLFASADDASMVKLSGAGLVDGAPTVFARNRMAIVVKRGNPTGLSALTDLGKVGVVSLCGAEVPCGTYADEILAKAGVAIPPRAVTRASNAKGALAAVADGDADAGIVYATDIQGDKVQAVTIPDAANVVTTYPIGVVRGSALSREARSFVAQVMGPAGQARLRDAGFAPP